MRWLGEGQRSEIARNSANVHGLHDEALGEPGPCFAGGVESPRGIEGASRENRSEAAWRRRRGYSERRSAQGFAREARRPAWRPAAAMRRAVRAAGPR